MTALGRWFRPPRHVLALFLGVTACLSLAMGWLAWQLIAQDRALAARRTQERLDNAADAAVAGLRRDLDDLAQRLDTLSKLDPAATSAEAARQAALLGDDVVLILADDRTFDAWPAGRLSYYPHSAPRRIAPASAVEAFGPGEALEFGRRDLAGALLVFDWLARSANPQVRAGALLRSARVSAQLHRPDRALRAYGELAALGAAPVEELPAGLLARYGRCVLLRDLGRTGDLGREAAALERELDEGRWRLSRPEYEFYRGRPSSGCSRRRVPSPVTRGKDVNGSRPRSPRRGTRGVPTLVRPRRQRAAGWCTPTASACCSSVRARPGVWRRSSAGRGSSTHVSSVPKTTLSRRYRARMVLADPGWHTSEAGEPVLGNHRVERAAADTRLPWSVLVADTDPGAELAAAAARSRIILAGLVALGLFVLAGSAFIVRAVKRELEVSRLQTDFVAAVSHEFRTPLTSMRQVSEVLLDGTSLRVAP